MLITILINFPRADKKNLLYSQMIILHLLLSFLGKIHEVKPHLGFEQIALDSINLQPKHESNQF